MKVKDFVREFSHNNPICVENKNSYLMDCIINKETTETDIMDWYLPHTNIGECEMIKISVVGHVDDKGRIKDCLTFVVDTEDKEFHMVPELCDLKSTPLWLYNATHDKKIEGCCG